MRTMLRLKSTNPTIWIILVTDSFPSNVSYPQVDQFYRIPTPTKKSWLPRVQFLTQALFNGKVRALMLKSCPDAKLRSNIKVFLRARLQHACQEFNSCDVTISLDSHVTTCSADIAERLGHFHSDQAAYLGTNLIHDPRQPW